MKKNPTDLDEQVFENRNKAYGAYRLRKAYIGIMIGAAVFVTVWMLFVFGGLPFLDGKENSGKVAKGPTEVPVLPLEIKNNLPLSSKKKDFGASTSDWKEGNQKSLEEKERDRIHTPNERFVPVVIPSREGDDPNPQSEIIPDPVSTNDSCDFGDPLAFGVDIEQEPNCLNFKEVRESIPYPPHLMDSCISGKVVVRILVGKKGEYREHIVLNKNTTQKPPHPDFIKVVEPRISKLEFTPAIMGGKPVCCWVMAPFNFKCLK